MTRIVLTAIVTLTLGCIASAAVVLEADFSDATNTPTTTPDVGTASNFTGTFVAQADAANVFGAGTSNGIVLAQKLSTTNGSARYTPTSQVDWGQFSFDFYETSATNSYLQIQFNGPGTVQPRFEDGGVSRSVTTVTGAYSVGQVNHVDILFNTSNTNQTSNGVSLDALKLAIYINGDLATTGTLTDTSNVWRIDPSTPATNGFLLDNFRLLSAEFNVVPEPATMAALGLGGLVMLRRRHR